MFDNHTKQLNVDEHNAQYHTCDSHSACKRSEPQVSHTAMGTVTQTRFRWQPVFWPEDLSHVAVTTLIQKHFMVQQGLLLYSTNMSCCQARQYSVAEERSNHHISSSCSIHYANDTGNSSALHHKLDGAPLHAQKQTLPWPFQIHVHKVYHNYSIIIHSVCSCSIVKS